MGQKSAADSNPVTLPIETAEAHDDPVGTVPVTIAGEAVTAADAAVPNEVSADSDQTRLKCDRDGVLYSHDNPPRIWSVLSSFTAAQAAATLKAGTAGLALYVKTVGVSAAATTGGSFVRAVLLNSSTVTIWARNFTAATLANLTDNIVPPIKLTVANSLLLTTTGGTTSVDVLVSGFTAP